MSTYKITVTQQDIDAGVRGSDVYCMASTAIGRLIPSATRISTDVQCIRFTDSELGIRYTYLTPREVQQYVIDYDAGDPIKPFSFTLSNPMTAPAQQSRGPKRLIVKEGGRATNPLRSRVRVYGLCQMRVNQDKKAARA
jgi:hypothetical protein